MTCKVLHVITGLSTGGAETMLYKLLSAMALTEVESTVISLTDKGTYGEKIEALGITVVTLEMSAGRPSFSALIKLRKLITTVRPDVIQAWMYHANIASSMACLLSFTSIPVLWNIRQSLDHIQTEKKSTKKVIYLGAFLSVIANKIIFNSKHSAAQHQKIGYREKKCMIIPNGFDYNYLKPSQNLRDDIRAELGIGDESILIGMIGRFHPLKDHANFLISAKIICQNYNDVFFLLAGTEMNEDNEALMRVVHECDLYERIFLLGERQDIPALNASLDIAALSSSSEAFPNVIGEAMACAVPCAATNVGDVEWIVSDTGRVVPPNNSTSLANAWSELIEIGQEGRRTLGNLARSRIMKCFSIESVVTQYRNLYVSCTKTKSPVDE